MQAIISLVWEHYERAASEWNVIFGGFNEEACYGLPDTKGEVPGEDMGKFGCRNCGDCTVLLVRPIETRTQSDNEVTVL